MTDHDRIPFHLIRELQARRRRRCANALAVLGFITVIVGMTMLTTDWFGTACIVMAVGWLVATLGSEMVS